MTPLVAAGGEAVEPLSREQQDAFLELIAQAVSPPSVCETLGISLAQFNETVDRQPAFRAALDALAVALNQNVEAALYHAAMKGNVPAQTLWLRKRPPPGWLPDDAPPPQDELDELSDADLIALARAQGVAIPPALASEADRESGAALSGGIPA